MFTPPEIARNHKSRSSAPDAGRLHTQFKDDTSASWAVKAGLSISSIYTYRCVGIVHEA